MSILPLSVEDQIAQYQGMLGKGAQQQQFGVFDKLGLIAASLGRGQGQGLGFGNSLGMAAGDLGQQTRQIEAYNRQLDRQNIRDQLNVTKMQADVEQQKRQEALQRAQLAISQGNLGLQREEFNLRRDQASQQQGLLGEYIKTLPPEQQQLAMLAPDKFVSAMVKNGMSPGADGIKPSVETEKTRRLGQSALNALDGIEQFYFDDADQTNLNRSAIMNSVTGAGRDADQRIKHAVGEILYTKTGAAATEGEIERESKKYTPSLLDTPEQAKRKIAALRAFAQDTIPAYARQSGGMLGGGSTIDFNSLPD